MDGSRDSYKKVVKNILQTITKHYSYLALREEEFEKTSSVLGKGVDKTKDNEKFFKHVLKSLSIMRDNHIRVVDETGKGIGAHKVRKRKNYGLKLSGDYFSEVNKRATITVGINGDVIYLGIESFANRHKLDFNRLYSEIDPGKFQKWIIDLRANGGGDDTLAKRLISSLAGRGASFVSSYTRVRVDEKNPRKFSEFTPRYVVPGKKYSRKEITVLIGSNTCSSAELVTMDLAAIPGTVLMGDITAGMSGGPDRYLVDGHLAGKKIGKKENPGKYDSRFALDIPSRLQYRLDQFLLQDRGTIPHVFIPASKSIIGGKDMVLEKAFEFYKNPFIY